MNFFEALRQDLNTLTVGPEKAAEYDQRNMNHENRLPDDMVIIRQFDKYHTMRFETHCPMKFVMTPFHLDSEWALRDDFTMMMMALEVYFVHHRVGRGYEDFIHDLLPTKVRNAYYGPVQQLWREGSHFEGVIPIYFRPFKDELEDFFREMKVDYKQV